MSKISKFSDHTPKCRLAEVGDIYMLQAMAEAAGYPRNAQLQIEKFMEQIAIEKARKIPSQDYIARLYKSIAKVKENIRINAFVNSQ